ncbi:MAG: hypothetical protein GXP26_07995 [Planctomycetes bacterium]|nr:hypothetical protein [Planctomycetota bacterium]
MPTNLRWHNSGVALLLCLGGLVATSQAKEPAEETTDSLLRDVAEAWDTLTPIGSLAEEETPDDSPSEILPVQMLTPQRRLGVRVAQRERRTTTASSRSSSATVPFMIGDTGAGTCLSLSGLLVDADLAHPTLTCSRLNISENNTPLPTDRVFFSYRHFRNATPARFFQFSREFDVNRFTIGGERTFSQGLFSVEVRVPMEGRMSSNMLSRDRSLFGGPTEPFAGGQAAEFGNISGIFKALLHESKTCAVSCGVGVTLPSAQDVIYEVDLLSSVTYFGFPAFFSERDVLLDFEIKNETTYLSPFLAWLWRPNSRFFHQGFCQIEVGVNPSNLRATGGGTNNFFESTVPFNFIATSNSYIQFPGRARINAQTLMRINLGIGYVLSENSQANWIQRLTGIFEAHYTATLQDAKNDTLLFVDELYGPGANPGDPPVFVGTFTTPISVGNRANSTNILNLVAGLSANMGNWVVTNGVAVPTRTGSDRGFDFEYNLQIQRPF